MTRNPAAPSGSNVQEIAVSENNLEEDAMPERIWAGDFDEQGYGHCVAGMQGGLYSEYVRADLVAAIAPQQAAPMPGVKALAGMLRLFDDEGNMTADFTTLQDAILAAEKALSALAHPQVTGVKELEWRKGYCDEEVDIQQASFGGLYQVRVLNGVIWVDWPSGRNPTQFPTIEAAKDAAQADFEARILSALAAPEAGTSEPVAVACDEDNMPERIWAGDFDGQGFGHCVAGMQGGLYSEYVRADLHPAPAQAPVDGEAVRALTDEQIDAAIREWMSSDSISADGFGLRMRSAIAAAFAATPSARKEP